MMSLEESIWAGWARAVPLGAHHLLLVTKACGREALAAVKPMRLD